jgi:chemotaxis protein methyltransferase CheR
MKTVLYNEYVAKKGPDTADAGGGVNLKKGLPRYIIDRLLLPYALLQHRKLLRQTRRVDDHTYTCFLRGPSQLELLSGPILDHLGRNARLNITLLACSSGAEPYTIASWLLQAEPGLDFHIRASDLHPEMVARAQIGRYTADEARHSDYITQSFLDATLVRDGDEYVVRREVRERVSFSVASLLDGDGLRETFGLADLVIAQNVLCHLPPETAAQAFANLVSLAKPGGAMMLEGMDLDLREQLTEEHQLEPFTENLRRVFEETRVHTPLKWWRYYWGVEPFIGLRSNATRRYATAFRRPAA